MVLGGETYLLRSDEMDESDLFRFGGATTLRGYDEERFRVPFATRLLAEYRYLVDSTSYGGVFFDLGFVDERHIRGFHPGFGLDSKSAPTWDSSTSAWRRLRRSLPSCARIYSFPLGL